MHCSRLKTRSLVVSGPARTFCRRKAHLHNARCYEIIIYSIVYAPCTKLMQTNRNRKTNRIISFLGSEDGRMVPSFWCRCACRYVKRKTSFQLAACVVRNDALEAPHTCIRPVRLKEVQSSCCIKAEHLMQLRCCNAWESDGTNGERSVECGKS